MLEANDLSCSKGDRLLFYNISFQLDAGSILRIVAPNGYGKTSLLRILCGLARAEAGNVLWNGIDIHRVNTAFQRDLLYLGHASALTDLLTPLENLRFMCRANADAVSEQDCIDALGQIGLEAERDLPVRVLSQGQRRRVMLARLSLSPARRMWILDEPFNALDTAMIAALAMTLQNHCHHGGSVVLTTHQDVPFAVSPRVLDLTRVSS